METPHHTHPEPGSRPVAPVAATAAVSLALCGCVGLTGDTGTASAGAATGAALSPGVPAVSSPAGPNAAGFSDAEAYNRYFAAGYNYIDAKVLADFWGEPSPSAAKLRMGRKILRFGSQDGAANLQDARTATLRKPSTQWPVSYTDGGYTFSDAEMLGRYWGGGPANSKMKMARFLMEGQDQRIRNALASARVSG